MRYKNEKLLQVRRKAAELYIGLSIALQKSSFPEDGVAAMKKALKMEE